MMLRSVLPVIFRKRPCLVTLLSSLSCCLHSPRHSKPIYMESQLHSRQNPAWFLRVRVGRRGEMGGEFCLLFSVRLLINIHPPTSENQAFGIRQTLCMRQSGVKSPKCPYLIVSKQNVEISRRNWRRGAFCTRSIRRDRGKVERYSFFSFPSARALPQKR